MKPMRLGAPAVKVTVLILVLSSLKEVRPAGRMNFSFGNNSRIEVHPVRSRK
jgi:hypothetical protein